jgi:hypothetical protein
VSVEMQGSAKDSSLLICSLTTRDVPVDGVSTSFVCRWCWANDAGVPAALGVGCTSDSTNTPARSSRVFSHLIELDSFKQPFIANNLRRSAKRQVL